MRKGLRGPLACCGLLLSFSAFPSDEANAAIPAAERAALIALYDSTSGEGWSSRTNWRNAADTDFNDPGTECTWFGVTCTGDPGDNVFSLDLHVNNLAGSLPPEIGAFAELRTLWLYSNHLTGPIPAEIGSLSHLQELNLNVNQLSGPIPAVLGSLPALHALSAEINGLSGPIPAELGGLANLQYLELRSNQLSGPIPSELGNLTALRVLTLAQNQLTGGIPPALGQLANLELLWLYGNPLGGTIPKELGGLAKLTSLVLQQDQLTGPIPAELAGLTSLQMLDLSDNQLSGDIPAALWTMSWLPTLRLGANQLTGSLPAAVASLTQLFELTLDRNQLSGSIPPEIGGLASLYDLELADNQLTGSIPSQLGNLTNLAYLSLHDNQLSGSIPSTLGNLAHAEQIDLSFNQLDGPIPASLGSLASLNELHLGRNRLSGSIPAPLGNLAALEILDVEGNQLSGEIPPELANLPNLYTASVYYNALHTSDPALAAFIESRAPYWQYTQTVAPAGVTSPAAATGSVLLSWTPIPYDFDAGGYRVRYGTTAGGPYPGVVGPTPGKHIGSTLVTGLAPDTSYYFVVEAVTEPHSSNDNTVVSEPGPESTAHTAGPSPVTYVLAVTTSGAGSGRVTSSPAGIDCGTDCSEAVVGDSVITLTATPRQGSNFAGWGGACTGTGPTCDVVVETGDVEVIATFTPPPPTAYFTVPPCRAFDSRKPQPVPLAAGSETAVTVTGLCNVPAGALAVSLNVAVTEPSVAGHLRLYPQGATRPTVAMLNYAAGQTRANNAVVPVSAAGQLAVYVNQSSGTAHVVIDVNGYYAGEATGDGR